MRRLVLALVLVAAGCGGGGGGGTSAWRSYNLPATFGITALWAFAPDDVWAGGQQLYHFDGTSFREVMGAPITYVADFWGFAPNDLYAVSGASLAHWDGTAWTLVDLGGAIAPTSLSAVWGTSANDLWLGDESNGRVFRYNGVAWSTGITQTTIVTDLWGVPGAGGAVYAAGVFGLARWTGAAWADIGDNVASEADGLWGFADNDVWAVGTFTPLAHWTGAAWTDTVPVDNPEFEDDHTSVWGSAPDDVWAVGDGGVISHWDGARWTQTQYGSFPYFPFLSEVHGSSADDIWIAGRTSDASASGIILHNAK